jgi:hypothetical protein
MKRSIRILRGFAFSGDLLFREFDTNPYVFIGDLVYFLIGKKAGKILLSYVKFRLIIQINAVG